MVKKVRLNEVAAQFLPENMRGHATYYAHTESDERGRTLITTERSPHGSPCAYVKSVYVHPV